MKTTLEPKTCNICNKKFTKPAHCSLTNWQERTFCSKSCANSRPARTPEEPLEGVVHGLNGYNMYGCRCDTCRDAIRYRKRLQRQGITIPRELWGHKGETNPKWKGDAVGYKCIHDWVRRYKTKSGICQNCLGNFGTESGHATHWANIDHAYRRDLADYIELCPSCHKKYDLENNHHTRTKK